VAIRLSDEIWFSCLLTTDVSILLFISYTESRALPDRTFDLVGERLRKFEWFFFWPCDSTLLYPSSCVQSIEGQSIEQCVFGCDHSRLVPQKK
jgi:hypothetical protein